MAIESYNSKHPLVMEIQQWLYLIFERHKKVEFCWVPSHIGISSNELADSNAKAAVHDLPVCNKGLPYSDYYPVIDSILKKEWQEEWSSITRNKLRSIKCTVSPWSSSYQKNRHWEVILARLRLGHTRLTHRHLMEKEHFPQCQNCNEQITVEHILIKCPLYFNERRLWLGGFSHNNATLTMKSLLQDSDGFNINLIIKYLDAIKLLGEI